MRDLRWSIRTLCRCYFYLSKGSEYFFHHWYGVNGTLGVTNKCVMFVCICSNPTPKYSTAASIICIHLHVLTNYISFCHITCHYSTNPTRPNRCASFQCSWFLFFFHTNFFPSLLFSRAQWLYSLNLGPGLRKSESFPSGVFHQIHSAKLGCFHINIADWDQHILQTLWHWDEFTS